MTLWVVIDPIGTVPVFVAVTAGLAPAQARSIAHRAALTAAAVLFFFLVLGQLLIDALGISLPAFQIAGSIVLFLFALTMIFGPSKPAAETKSLEEGTGDSSPAVFPLAVPSLASPGAMLAVVLLTDNHRFSIPEQAVTGVVMLAVCASAWLCMIAAQPILQLIGMNGAAIVSRVMGLVLASVAVDGVIDALLDLIASVEGGAS